MPIRPGKSGQEESPHGLSTAKIQLFNFLCTAIQACFAMFGTSHYIYYLGGVGGFLLYHTEISLVPPPPQIFVVF